MEETLTSNGWESKASKLIFVRIGCKNPTLHRKPSYKKNVILRLLSFSFSLSLCLSFSVHFWVPFSLSRVGLLYVLIMKYSELLLHGMLYDRLSSFLQVSRWADSGHLCAVPSNTAGCSVALQALADLPRGQGGQDSVGGNANASSGFLIDTVPISSPLHTIPYFKMEAQCGVAQCIWVVILRCRNNWIESILSIPVTFNECSIGK